MKPLILAVFIFTSLVCWGQYPNDTKRDNLWPFGYGAFPGQTDSSFGITWLSYSSQNLEINLDYKDIDLGESNAVACDTAGQLLFVTNGIFIFDSTRQIMQACDTLSPGKWAEWTINIGYIIPNGVLALPKPGNESEWFVFHEHMSSALGSSDVDSLYYTVVDMQLNGGLGAVTSMRNPLLHLKLDYGKLTACRHANGRDWWMIVFNDKLTQYARLLLTPNGVETFPWVTFNAPALPFVGLGQSAFTEDGNMFATYSGLGADSGEYLEVFDFDRCAGFLSNARIFHINDSCTAGGLAISSNSRFAYTSCGDRVYQYDLQAADIGASETLVATWDGFKDPLFPVGTLFYLMGKTPDGKILIASPNSVHYLHTIDSPDSAGLACNLLQHNLHIPTYNAASMPNYPNFRLGPVDGSACDTLGIDVAINEVPKSTQTEQTTLQVYPNPAASYCNIGFGNTLKQDGAIIIYDLNGRKVFEASLQKATIGYTLKTESYTSGLYLCVAYEGSNEKGNVRFVKE